MPSIIVNTKPTLAEALLSQRLVMGEADIAEAIAKRAKTQKIAPGKIIITQGAFDDTVYFILAGLLAVIVDDQEVAQLAKDEQVGEVAVVLPSIARSATVVAIEPSVVAKLSSTDFIELANQFPMIWLQLAKLFAQRLYHPDVKELPPLPL